MDQSRVEYLGNPNLISRLPNTSLDPNHLSTHVMSNTTATQQPPTLNVFSHLITIRKLSQGGQLALDAGTPLDAVKSLNARVAY